MVNEHDSVRNFFTKEKKGQSVLRMHGLVLHFSVAVLKGHGKMA